MKAPAARCQHTGILTDTCVLSTSILSTSVLSTSILSTSILSTPPHAQASFSIKNSNAFYILNWRLHFSLVGWSSFTWGPSDTDLKYAGTKTNAQVGGRRWWCVC